MNKFEEVKEAVLRLENIDYFEYSKLVEVYGEKLVKKVLSSDKRIFNKLNMDIDREIEYSYDYYVSDVSQLVEISFSEKKEVILAMTDIINKLDNLFRQVGDIVCLDNDKKKPWISDKVNYCIYNCDDKELLDNIKSLYNKYIEKRNILVEANLKFVIFLSKFIYNGDNGLDFDDLLQYGNLGLIRACETYDLSYGTEFVTYAGYWIKQSIINNSKKEMYFCKIPVYLCNTNNKRLDAVDNLCYRLGRIPSNQEVADYMGISVSKVDDMVKIFTKPISLDESSGIYLDGLDVTRIELVEDDTIDIYKDLSIKNMAVDLDKYIDMFLSDRDRFILRSRFGFGECMKSASELADLYGISVSRIEYIKSRALVKLRDHDEVKAMWSYLR